MTTEEKLAETRLKQRGYDRRYYEANKDKMTAKKRARHSANKALYGAVTSKASRKRKYGISQDQFEGMLASQNSACAICKTPEPKGNGTFHVDHCHETKVVRGLLCHSCNVGLGHFRDDTAVLLSAVAYLSASRTIH